MAILRRQRDPREVTPAWSVRHVHRLPAPAHRYAGKWPISPPLRICSSGGVIITGAVCTTILVLAWPVHLLSRSAGRVTSAWGETTIRAIWGHLCPRRFL